MKKIKTYITIIIILTLSIADIKTIFAHTSKATNETIVATQNNAEIINKENQIKIAKKETTIDSINIDQENITTETDESQINNLENNIKEDEIKDLEVKNIEPTSENQNADTKNNENNQSPEKLSSQEKTEETPTAEDIGNTNNTEATSSEEVVEESLATVSQEESNNEDSTNTNANNIVATAQNYLGYSYVAGGSSPSGFDCSGFTQYVYGQNGISLSRTSTSQANDGTAISKDELQAGDLLLFHYYGSESVGHTGIYIGDGQFIHAANSNRGVVIDSINSGYYYENYAGARRVQ